MTKIYKYPLEIMDKQKIDMPDGARILSAAVDPNGRACIWAAVDPTKPIKPVSVIIVGTGHPLPNDCYFIGTLIQSPFVWHVFEYFGA